MSVGGAGPPLAQAKKTCSWGQTHPAPETSMDAKGPLDPFTPGRQE